MAPKILADKKVFTPRCLFPLILLLLFSMPAMAWQCPNGQIRQQAAAGTPGSIVVEGLSFVCVNPLSNAPTSTATSDPTSTSTATGGASSATQTQTAAGGNATSTAQGGAGGNGTASATATGNGSNSGNNSNNSTTTNSVHIPTVVETAYAPSVGATIPCFKGFGAGVQTQLVGASFGAGKVDENCRALETARSFEGAGSHVAYCKVMLTTKDAKAAHVSMEDCLNVREVVTAAPVAQVQPQIILPAPQVTINNPAPILPAQVIQAQAPATAAVAPVKLKHRIKPCPAVTPSK